MTTFKNEADVLIAIKNGDESALNELYHILQNMAKSFTLSNEDRNDIIQDTIICMWKSAHTINTDIKNARAYIYKCLKGKIKTFMDRKEKEPCEPFSQAFYDNDNDNCDPIDEIVSKGKERFISCSALPDVESDYFQKENCLKIYENINKLNDNYRDTMNFYISGYTREETAKFMNKSPSDISNYHKRAKNKLRESLENEAD